MKLKPRHIRSPRGPRIAIRRARKNLAEAPAGQDRPPRMWSLLLPPSFPPDQRR